MLLKSFRYLLLPISLLYGMIIWLRNWLFDKNIFRSSSFNFPVICVGNLAIGGTGKTPMTEYLLTLLKDKYQVATLSRGYKRKTKGFAIATTSTTALDIGDEPMQFHQKFPEVTVAVGEERLVAVPQILHDRPETELIILDDAFQHRSIQAGLNIILTDFNNLYTRDFMMPAGDLRDTRSSAKRADIIIVTKCPANLSVDEKEKIIIELKPISTQKVYFTEIIYSPPLHLFSRKELRDLSSKHCLLITGIANPQPLKEFLNKITPGYDMLRYADHHIFSSDDLRDIIKGYEKMPFSQKIILTTEKDSVRLVKYEAELKVLPIYVIPVAHRIMFGEAGLFAQEIISYISKYNLPE